jgi:hypothetical protein
MKEGQYFSFYQAFRYLYPKIGYETAKATQACLAAPL